MEKTTKMVPPNISDSGMIDDDSGLRLFRGMMSPWDQIKSFKETYKFLVRHASLFAVSWISVLRIIEPDYAKRQTTMSDIWAGEMKEMWDEDDSMGLKAGFYDRFSIPPFLRSKMYPVATYCDKGDEQTLLTGYIWYASADRMEKEIHVCDFDIVGPEACDLSQGGGQYFCRGIAGWDNEINNYNSERMGCGDPYCHVVIENRKKYGEHPNDFDKKEGGYEWEHWGPPNSGMRPQRDAADRKMECDWMTSGTYVGATGGTWTAGEMYKDYCQWPMAYSTHAINAIRQYTEDENYNSDLFDGIIETMFEANGKFYCGDWTTRKAIRDWMGVPESVDDGRVMGGYISMLLQARSVEYSVAEFSEERVLINCDKAGLEMFGMFPELTKGYEAFLNGMVKCLVNTRWVVKISENDDGDLQIAVEKGLYGYRRQKETLDFEENKE